MNQSPGCFTGMSSAWRWLTGLFTMSAAAPDGAGTCSTSSAASAANGGNQREGVSFAALPAEVTPAIAECLSSYADLCAFRRIDKGRHGTLTPTVLLPILQRLLVVLPSAVGLGSLVVCLIPQLPLPEALSHGCCITALIKELSRRLWMMERGGSWARWKPVLEMLYLLRGKRPLVLGDDNFGVFGSRAAFMRETETIRQWKMLSWGVTIGSHQRPLMDGDKIRDRSFGYRLPTLLTKPSPHFPHDTFDPADPPTDDCGTYATYTSMAAFVLRGWLGDGGHTSCARYWLSDRFTSAASRRVSELLAAPPSDVAQWGATVFDKRPGWHYRLVVFGSEAMGEGDMAVIELTASGDLTDSGDWTMGAWRLVHIYTTESAPHDQTRSVVMRVLGDHLGGMVWRRERET
ncbi:unnamed protein product [Vitrella brassicaformis CCMP3155]|uniref:Uncharacterized protein n=1 Tax=Vitrella brassicaformis (strain CCMP3155) TaxID=1169540 RepID=A0A0G4EX12_VITBC|nr:unnamed protein product [Vitrella brassicaformis CCMP3155]|eukprot:CEM03532.1 unnamed protein product [Vitrella brassicaformis CCMP3155]